MRCARCKADNLAEDSHYCSHCGHVLCNRCSACGTESVPGARFCSGCGKALQQEADSSPSGPMIGERRQLTILFCDMIGSSALANRLDPEEMQALEQWFRECCIESVERYEGWVSHFLGDGVLIHFGLPRAHEDDAERAVRAALDIMRRLAKMDTSLTGDCDLPPVRARIGIATGLVVVTDAQGGNKTGPSMTGVALNLTARLQELAEPGGIVLSDLTRVLVGNLFNMTDLGTRHLKGFEKPERVWSVQGESRQEGRFEARHEAGRLSAFVGRSWEAELMRDRFAMARSGHGRVILVSGEAGIGKSRLIEEFRAEVSDAVVWRLRYFCLPYHVNTPFFPIIAQMRNAAGIEAEQDTQTKLAHLASVLGPVFGADDTAMTLCADLLSIPTAGHYPELGLSSQQRRRRTQELLVDITVGLATSRPVLFLFEDAHWIDPSTSEVMERVVLRAAELPFLLVMTARPEYRPNWVDLPHVTFLTLNRMDQRDSVEIAETVAGGKSLPASVIAEIVKRTDGVPLFVEELTKALLESELLVEGDNAYTLKGELPALAVPNTLRASLTARLDRLDSARAVAETASVIGRSFSFALLAEVTGLDEVELLEALDRLMAAGLITRSGVPLDAVYSFKHALVQDTAYHSLLRGRRAAIHRRVAGVLTNRYPSTRTQEPGVLAHHYVESGQTELAIACLEEAGMGALAGSNYVEGVAILRRTLELLGTQPASAARNAHELRLQTALGGALIVTNGFAAAEVGTAYQRAADLCGEIGNDAPALNPIRYGVFVYHLVRSELRLARELAVDFVRDTSTSTDPTDQLVANRTLGSGLVFMGEWQDGINHLDRALDLYDRARHGGLAVAYAQDPRIAAMTMKSWALFFTGRIDEALELGKGAIAEAQGFGHLHTLAYSIGLSGVMLSQFCHDVPEVRKNAKLLAEICSRQPMPIWAGIAHCLEGWATGINGDVETGLIQLRQGYDDFNRTGARLFLPYYNALMGEVYAAGNLYEEAMGALDHAVRLNAANEEGWFAADLDRIRGDVLLAAGDPEAARAAYGRGLKRAEQQGGLLSQLRCATGLAEILLAEGEPKAARMLLEPLFCQVEQGYNSLILLRARRALSAHRHGIGP